MTAWLLLLLAATPLDGGSTAPTIQGSLDKDVIRRVMRQHTRQNSSCYETVLRKDAKAQGKVSVTFTIERDGTVKHAEMKEDGVGNSGLSSCIVSAMKSLVFPAPQGGGVVIVSYPFTFSPAN
jgi:TonB family protein